MFPEGSALKDYNSQLLQFRRILKAAGINNTNPTKKPVIVETLE